MYKKVSKEIILIVLMAAYLIVPASKSVVQLSHAQPNQDMQVCPGYPQPRARCRWISAAHVEQQS